MIAEFEAEGHTPTEEEIVARVQARIDAILAERTDTFAGSVQFKRLLDQALRPLPKLDMSPENSPHCRSRRSCTCWTWR